MGTCELSKTCACQCQREQSRIILSHLGEILSHLRKNIGVTWTSLFQNVKNTQVVALITSAHTLVEIRRKRSIELGLNNTDNDYIDIHKVEEEITTAKRIFANKGWPVIDITRRSVEETASAIMNILSLKEEENVERK